MQINKKYLATLCTLLLLICISFPTDVVAQQNAVTQKENDNAVSNSTTPFVNALLTLNNVYKFNNNYPHEKVYLHFDNNGYFIGEKIWFKAYVTQPKCVVDKSTGKYSNQMLPTTISKVLYVDLVAPSGDVLKTQKYHIDENGGADGALSLDSILSSGFYEVRAYTRYMTNWGAEALFSRTFPIYEKPKQYGNYTKPTIEFVRYKDRNPNTRVADSLYLVAAKDGIYTNDDPKKINVKFFPEGGNLVLGAKCRVAMLAIDDNGASYKGKGQILNIEGKTVCEVETDKYGRAVFEFTPLNNEYKLVMTNPKGKKQEFQLPTPLIDGCALNLDVVSDNMIANIENRGNVIGKAQGYALLHNGAIFHCDTMMAAKSIELELDRKILPEGVNQLTIFNENGQILAERLFFICPKNSTSDSILFTPKTKTLGPCSVVEIETKAKPGTIMSFSAVDANSMMGTSNGNAQTWMLLSSDVKGYIADVDYYFEADDEEHRKNADLLMMIQGWRRYDWNLMSGKKWFETVQPIEDQLYLYGQLREYMKKNPVGNVNVETYLFNKQGNNLKGQTYTDSLGYYILNLPDIEGDWQLHISTKTTNSKNKKEKRKTYYVGIDRQFAPVPRFITPDETKITDRQSGYFFGKQASDTANIGQEALKFAEKVKVLPQVTIRAKRYFTDDSYQPKYDQKEGRRWATVFYNAPQELDKILDEGNPMPTVFEFLAERNPLFGHPAKHDLPHLTDLGYIRMDDDQRVQIQYNEFEGGMGYNGRKIHWIIDNGLGEGFSDISHFYYKDSAYMRAIYEQKLDVRFEGFGVNLDYKSFENGTNMVDFPMNMDEIKAIYIVPDSPEEINSCVRIYIYRRHIFSTNSQKGWRKTIFQGYTEPEVFTMEDTNILPPLENLRRTLFWAPNVKVDEKGVAKIEFYNNMSCSSIHLNAEGLSPDGQFLISK